MRLSIERILAMLRTQATTSPVFLRLAQRRLLPQSPSSLLFPQAHSVPKVLMIFLLSVGLVFLGSCAGVNEAVQNATDESLEGETSGPAYSIPPITLSPTNASEADKGYEIDISTASEGYVGVAAISSARLKFQVTLGEMSYNYDLPSDGSPIVCPVNMGNGSYTFTVWENTSGDRYVELGSTTVDIALNSEFAPFIRPSYFCMYTESSSSIRKASELVSGTKNQGDVVKNVYNWIVENIDYDTAKASSVADGYVPDPDSTLQNSSGICFDYASLAAAMLRSQGIPTKIMTGYLSPDNIYHAWNMVYIDGRWNTISVNIEANTWSRIDTTFAAGGASSFVGDGKMYTDRYTY